MASSLTRPAFAPAPVIHLTMEQVVDRVGLRKSKIYELIRAGDFPDSMKLSPGAARWNEADIDGWIARMKRDCRG
ncbi:helix-turn-helix transcriptional regulator [Novosphingobium rosa]|uniref:helix-turn-helix transcriptional regulator n=1 Tax=Novosphingobium rosa TaxID=76978 RepID=UPI000834B22B|nr:AlpA family phage regulatory protein [Novosphingobium rosa]